MRLVSLYQYSSSYFKKKEGRKERNTQLVLDWELCTTKNLQTNLAPMHTRFTEIPIHLMKNWEMRHHISFQFQYPRGIVLLGGEVGSKWGHKQIKNSGIGMWPIIGCLFITFDECEFEWNGNMTFGLWCLPRVHRLDPGPWRSWPCSNLTRGRSWSRTQDQLEQTVPGLVHSRNCKSVVGQLDG